MSLMGQTVLKLVHISCLTLLCKVTTISGENPGYLGCHIFSDGNSVCLCSVTLSVAKILFSRFLTL